MKKKAVIFDFDGTLCESFPLIEFGVNGAYEKIANKNIDEEELFKCFGPTEEGIFKKLFHNDERLYKKAFIEYLRIYKENHNKFIHFDKEMDEIIKFIKDNNAYCFVLTGRSLDSLNISLEELKIKDRFHDFYFGSIEGVNKPTSFKNVFKEYDLTNEDVLYIGDSSEDVRNCNEVGVKIISTLIYSKYEESKILELNKENAVYDFSELKSKIGEFIL